MPNVTYQELDVIKKELEEKLEIANQSTAYKFSTLNYELDKSGRNVSLSERSIARIWNEYVYNENTEKDFANIGTPILDILVQILGYQSWLAYKREERLKRVERLDTEDPLFDPSSIDVDNLKPGEVITVG